MSYAAVVEAWRTDEAFRDFFLNELSTAPFQAYFWETRPVTAGTMAAPFEHVLVDSPALAGIVADPAAFAEHFDAGTAGSVVSFGNLSGDAELVVPRPIADASVYPHLAVFVRTGPREQKHALLERVGTRMMARVSSRTVWLSTAGLGVSWLHVRLDSRPKYYNYQPYRAQGT
jgi:hypothetical protein